MATEFSGKLHVNVLRGRDLAVGQALGSSDPYCVLCLDNQKFKTKTISRDSNPTWDQTFVFTVNKPLSSLELVVWDENSVSADTFMGKFQIQLLELSDQKPTQRWIPLKKRNDKDNVSGDILLSLQYKFLASWDPIYKGCIAIQQKNYVLGIKLLSESIIKNPEIATLYSYRSEAYIALGNIQEAHEDAQKVIQINPNIADGYYRIGVVYFYMEEYVQAEESFKLGLKYEPDDQNCINALKNIQINTIKQKVIKTLQRGRLAFEKGEFLLAVNYFTEAIEINPKNPIYYVYRCITKLALKEDVDAMEDALKITQLQPNWPKINPSKQGYLMKQGQVNVMQKKRWFILKNIFLFYYNTSKDLKINGVILLSNIELQKRKKKQLRIVTPFNRTYELQADSEQERNEWLTTLEKLWNTKLTLPKADENEETVILESEQTKTGIETVQNFFNSTVSGALQVAFTPVTIASSLSDKISSALTTVSLETADYQGFLYKTGQFQITPVFKKRYFVLKGKELFYCNYKEEDIKKLASVTPSGSIPLENCKVVYAQEKAQKEFAFELITPGRRYLLSASNGEEMQEWVRVISSISGDIPPPLPTSAMPEPALVLPPPPAAVVIEETKPEVKPRVVSVKPIVEEEEELEYPDSSRNDSKASSEARYFSKFGLPPPEHDLRAPVSEDYDEVETPLLTHESMKRAKATQNKEKSGCCCTIQ